MRVLTVILLILGAFVLSYAISVLNVWFFWNVVVFHIGAWFFSMVIPQLSFVQICGAAIIVAVAQLLFGGSYIRND